MPMLITSTYHQCLSQVSADDGEVVICLFHSVCFSLVFSGGGQKEKGTGQFIYDLEESSLLGHGFYFLNCILSCLLESTIETRLENLGHSSNEETLLYLQFCWHNSSILSVKSLTVDCIRKGLEKNMTLHAQQEVTEGERNF